MGTAAQRHSTATCAISEHKTPHFTEITAAIVENH